jgi:hypothetical protein
VDVDSLLRRVYGPAKQGAAFGHAKVGGYNVRLRGLSPLVAAVSTDQAAPVVAATRLRGGNAGVGQILQRLQHQHRGDHRTRHRRPAPPGRKQVSEQPIREDLTTMLGQQRVHTARRDQMPPPAPRCPATPDRDQNDPAPTNYRPNPIKPR